MPRSYIVVSDGSYTRRSRRIIEGLHRQVRVIDLADVVPPRLPACVETFARRHPFGKKLALELALPLDGATLYVDSDVLFFPAAAGVLPALVSGNDPSPKYLPDCRPCLDQRLLRSDELQRPVNSGVFVLHEPLDWEEGIQRLAALNAPPVFHTEQTVVHIALHRSRGRPLDSDRFIVANDDEHDYGDRYRRRDIVLRHYTSRLRHKLWCAVARDSLLRVPLLRRGERGSDLG